MYRLTKQISVLGLLCILSSGCQKGANPVVEDTASNSAHIPTMTESELVALSDSQWDELERRCLGLSDPTCTLMSASRALHERISDLNKGMKDAARALDEFKAEHPESP